MKKMFATLAILATVLLPLALVNSAQAVTSTMNRETLGTEYAGQIGLGGADIRTTIASVIRTAMGLLGIVAVVIILIGGFTWMTAGGNDDKVGEAKKWIFSGIIGLAIILSAYALSSFVIDKLLIATSDDPNIVNPVDVR